MGEIGAIGIIVVVDFVRSVQFESTLFFVGKHAGIGINNAMEQVADFFGCDAVNAIKHVGINPQYEPIRSVRSPFGDNEAGLTVVEFFAVYHFIVFGKWESDTAQRDILIALIALFSGLILLLAWQLLVLDLCALFHLCGNLGLLRFCSILLAREYSRGKQNGNRGPDDQQGD